MNRLLLRYGLLLATLLVGGMGTAQTPLGVFAEINNPSALVALDDGRVLIDAPGQVVVFAADGTPLGPFNPAGLDLPLLQLADGRVLVTQSDDVLAFEPDGTYLGVFADDLNGPVDAIQLADGRVLIAEYGTTGTGRVSAYDPDGTPLRPFVRSSDAPNPFSLTQLDDGRVLVLYNDLVRIVAYAPDGTPLGPFFADGPTSAFGKMLQLPDGRVLVANVGGPAVPSAERGQTHLFTPEGERLGPFTEGIQSPSWLALLADGRVLVASYQEGRIYTYGVIPVASESTPEAGTAVSAAYPSPMAAGTPARLAVAMSEPGEVVVTVFDATGREVSRKVHALGSGRQSVEVETAGLSAGVYAVRVVGTEIEATRRLVVAR